MNGLHLIGDLTGCRCDPQLLLEGERFRAKCVELVEASALTAHAAPKRVLIIGGGDGGSSEEALKHPSVEQVTMVEIDADVIDVAKQHFQAVHNGVFGNPKLRVLIEDGMKFVRDTQERFDLVTLDLNDPVGPAAALYSGEFFQQLRQTLAPGGALTLHL